MFFSVSLCLRVKSSFSVFFMQGPKQKTTAITMENMKFMEKKHSTSAFAFGFNFMGSMRFMVKSF